MVFVLSCETLGSIRVLGIVYKFFSADIVVLCVLPWAPVVSTRSGSTFHPLALMSSIRPSYFAIFSFILSGEYLSLQYVNSMNCTVNVGLGWTSGSALYGWLRMHCIDGCVCIVCSVVIWHCIGIFVFGYCRYMVVANVVLCFLEFVHWFFLHSLECSIMIWHWILRIYKFLGLLCCVD
jgi:hypothetical protein